jgi:hypothetical protein
MWRRKILALSRLDDVDKKKSDSNRLDEIGRKKYVQAEWKKCKGKKSWIKERHCA